MFSSSKNIRIIGLKFASVFVIFAVAIFTVCAVSCTSFFNGKRGTYSEEEADYALHFALNTAISQTMKKLPAKTEDLTFISLQYKELEEQKNNITGMKQLILSYNQNVVQIFNDHFDEIEIHLTELAQNLVFTDARSSVKTSNISASDAFIAKFSDSLTNYIAEFYETSDYKTPKACIKQYNAWIITESVLSGSQPKTLEIVDTSEFIASVFCETIFELMHANEELYRTTPDPFADKVAGIVFGIN